MTWNNSLNTGHAQIDTDHKKLVAYINELYDAMKSGKGKEACGKIIDNLASYTKTHFDMEERLMASAKYQLSADHKKEHDALVKEVLDFKAKFDAGAITLSLPLLNFLKDWLTKHIQGSDFKMVAAIKA